MNLALQGGGAHGAFTWGVLDRLLEEEHIELDGISGASAGAINAVALAAGLTEGGRPGARAKLHEIWEAVSRTAPLAPVMPPAPPLPAMWHQPSPSHHFLLDVITRFVSPYDVNPWDIDPLRAALERRINFASLRRRSPIRLFVAATDVSSGRERIFETSEISLDVVLASLCLPQLRKAVKIGRHHYWDGGYSANPPIIPLVLGCRADDTVIVQIDPGRELDLPTSAQEILARLSRITFNAPLRREIELIAHVRAIAGDGIAFGGKLRRRWNRQRFHHISGGDVTRRLGAASKLHPEWAMLCHLRDAGRATADAWIKKNGEALGRRSTLDLVGELP